MLFRYLNISYLKNLSDVVTRYGFTVHKPSRRSLLHIKHFLLGFYKTTSNALTKSELEHVKN